MTKNFLSFFLLCNSVPSSENQPSHAVIFVHGTIISRKDIPKLLVNFNKQMWEEIENKRWKRDLQTLRAIYGNQSGLHLINNNNISKNIFENVFTPFKKNFECYISKNTLYYMFNWSGTLLKESRKNASEELAKEIIRLKKENPSINITIICHSHGGNVGLGVAKILKETEIAIDHIVLLGTPINKDTERWALAKNKEGAYIFKKIINIFSRWDWIQPLDIFSNNYSFCKQSFPLTGKETNIINQKENTETHWSFYYYFNKKKIPFFIQVPKIINNLN
jgi:hypothetical protein